MKRNWLLIAVAVVLATVYVIYFTGWFQPKIIHITSTNARANRVLRGRNDSSAVPVVFKLGRPCQLTELKVVALDEWQTNKNCLPLWHLVASTNSVPIARPFYYGEHLPGMKPEVPGLRAQPLQPGVQYRLFVTDGSARGEHDFKPVARPDNPAGP